jgi:hypothetical protein
LRASYVILDNAAVIKVSQDISYTAEGKERYVVYFFVAPEAGQTYIIYRAIVDYDASTEETRIIILAFDVYIKDNKLVSTTPVESEAKDQSLDVDIAYGYENVSLSAVETDRNIKNIIGQIEQKYATLIKGKSLYAIEMMELKNGKLNYKIIYFDPVTHLTLKFIVFYNPVFQKILLLNTVNMPSSQQFQELSEDERNNDPELKEALKLLGNLHKYEMSDYKLQCIAKGVLEENVIEYHITWTSRGTQYRSYVKSYSGSLKETSFGELQTISLDHYRLDEFEKMFITSFQKLSENEIKGDTNFNLAWQSLISSNGSLSDASLIGVAQKPMSLGYIYHIFMRLYNGVIVRGEVYLESFSLKTTIKGVFNEDFTSNLFAMNLQDNSVKKIVEIVEKQATNPTLEGNSYTVQSVQGKDFLFGKLFIVSVSNANKEYEAFVYHDQSSEEVLMLNWGPKNQPSGCSMRNDMGECTKCVEGYTPINNICTFGCGVLCRTVNF